MIMSTQKTLLECDDITTLEELFDAVTSLRRDAVDAGTVYLKSPIGLTLVEETLSDRSKVQNLIATLR